jgi:hypothetical protein
VGAICRTRDPNVTAEIDRLNTELAKLPAEWRYIVKHE